MMSFAKGIKRRQGASRRTGLLHVIWAWLIPIFQVTQAGLSTGRDTDDTLADISLLVED